MSCCIESCLHKMVLPIFCYYFVLLADKNVSPEILFLILCVLLAVIASGSALNSCESAIRYSATFLVEKLRLILRYH